MIGVFGGAFNPPTRGHLDLISQALQMVDQILLVPSINHAFGKSMLSFERRCTLVKAFIDDINDNRIQLCKVEKAIWDGQSPVYTIDVLRRLSRDSPHVPFAFLCGPDNIVQISRFKDSEEITRTWPIICPPQRIQARSTLVREAIASHQEIFELVTPSVKKAIKKDSLYE